MLNRASLGQFSHAGYHLVSSPLSFGCFRREVGASLPEYHGSARG